MPKKAAKRDMSFYPLWLGKSLTKTNQNPGMKIGPTPTHGTRNGLSFYAGLERLDQQHGRALQSRANHQPTPLFGKIKLCLTLTTGPYPFSRNLGLSKPQRGRFIWNRIFRRKPCCWFGAHKIDPICQKIKKTLFHLKNQIKYSNFEKISRFV